MKLAQLTAERLATRLNQPTAQLELEILCWLGPNGQTLSREEVFAVNRVAQGVREHLVRVRPAWAALRAAGLVLSTPTGLCVQWRVNLAGLEAA